MTIAFSNIHSYLFEILTDMYDFRMHHFLVSPPLASYNKLVPIWSNTCNPGVSGMKDTEQMAHNCTESERTFFS
jgi:hypothetical protein